jgi:hypothetical protein
VACAVIHQGFSEDGVEPAELLEEGHVFSRHFKAEEAPRGSPAGLQMLADAADRMAPSRRGSTPGVAQDKSTRDTQARQAQQAQQAQKQLTARNEGPVPGQMLQSTLCDLPQSFNGTGHCFPSTVERPMVAQRCLTQQPGTVGPADAHFRDSASREAIQNLPFMNQSLDSGHILQPQWQQYADPDWTQPLSGSAITLNNAFDPHQDRLGQVHVATGQCTDEFWPEAWLDDLARAGGFST